MDAEDLCHGHQDVGAWWLVALFPEGDVLLPFTDEACEFSLAEACCFAECREASALGGSGLGELSSHAKSISLTFG